MRRDLAAFVIACAALCAPAAAQTQTPAGGAATDSAQTQADADSFTAVVKPDEARFTLPVPRRAAWRWRLPETRESAQEYRMDVSVRNAGTEYTFGFYLWKPRGGSAPGAGTFSNLLNAGQKSLFERPPGARLFGIVRDGGVRVGVKGDRLAINLDGRKNVARLFSDKPPQVTFNITVPGEAPKSQTVAVRYQD